MFAFSAPNLLSSARVDPFARSRDSSVPLEFLKVPRSGFAPIPPKARRKLRECARFHGRQNGAADCCRAINPWDETQRRGNRARNASLESGYWPGDRKCGAQGYASRGEDARKRIVAGGRRAGQPVKASLPPNVDPLGMKGADAALEGVAADGSLHLCRFMTAKCTQIPFRAIKSLEAAPFARQEAKCPRTVRSRL